MASGKQAKVIQRGIQTALSKIYSENSKKPAEYKVYNLCFVHISFPVRKYIYRYRII